MEEAPYGKEGTGQAKVLGDWIYSYTWSLSNPNVDQSHLAHS